MKRTIVSLAALVALVPIVAVAAAAPTTVQAQAPSATEVPVTTTTTTVPPSRPTVAAPVTGSAEATIVGPTTPKQTEQQAPAPQGGTWEATFNRMKGQLPGNYVIADKGSWGATNLSTGTVYIARRTPLRYLDDVMKHEAIHVMQGRVYGGISNARAKLGPYGGIEAVADCGARMLGATWTHYVSGCSSQMNHAARAMLNGVPA